MAPADDSCDLMLPHFQRYGFTSLAISGCLFVVVIGCQPVPESVPDKTSSQGTLENSSEHGGIDSGDLNKGPVPEECFVSTIRSLMLRTPTQRR